MGGRSAEKLGERVWLSIFFDGGFPHKDVPQVFSAPAGCLKESRKTTLQCPVSALAMHVASLVLYNLRLARA